MNTLLTGFGPFGNVVSNPTERLVAHFAREGVAGHELTTCLLPVSYARVPGMLRTLREKGGNNGKPFDLILHLGVAAGSKHWRVELFGRNQIENAPDAENARPPASVISPDAPEAFDVTLPTDELVSALEQAGIPVIASQSAGAYLCNYALFHTLHALHGSELPTRAGFLHVPADEQTFARGYTATAYPFTQHIEAVQIVLNTLAARS